MKLIFLVIINLSVFVSLTSCGNQNESIAKHKINYDIFVKVPVRWPSKENSVTIIFSGKLPENYKACTGLETVLSEFYKDDNPRLSMGEYCDTLFVLINYPDVMTSLEAREFAAAHESFHIAHQLYGTPYIMGLKLESTKFGFVSDFTKVMMDNLKPENKKFFCERIESYLNALPKLKQNLILYKSTYEWPAEFYSKQYVFGDDDNGYYKLRDSISNYLEGDASYWLDFYKLSIPVIKNIEEKINRTAWQSRVNDGDSIFDILMEVNGCETYTEQYFRVDVNKWELKESY